jgi:hypothetical protein
MSPARVYIGVCQAFSPPNGNAVKSQGVALGWYGAAPSVLKAFLLFLPNSANRIRLPSQGEGVLGLKRPRHERSIGGARG